ncbi:histidine kinase [Bacillus sp. M6-12]|uniref:ATP-binding protein n=1 Tax=Bacillus sp. M6-12 TaxID=2054166 RepID=UPI000C786279|nr:ATP-binding protein [Bacillus sp. M6-12]PLS18137.1 histidine kinase [Bacillus sp. M6-12]
MNIKEYIKRSLTRQVIFLMGIFFLIFLIGSSVFFYTQQRINDIFIKERNLIAKKESLISQIYNGYDTAFMDMRGYIAFNNEDLRDNAIEQAESIRKATTKFAHKATTEKEKLLILSIEAFTDEYFSENIPKVIGYVENGNLEAVRVFANSEATKKVSDIRNKLWDYSKSLQEKRDQKAEDLARNQNNLQLYFICFLALFLIILFRVMRVFLRDIGRPLSDLAFAANEVAAGREGFIEELKRRDELGALSIAFKKMLYSIQDKEQNLLAQNEELTAQQDELQAQQETLEETLEILRENEQMLTRRNELINGISNTLNRSELLGSIVKNMCRIIGADKGIVFLLAEQVNASYGISGKGIELFIEHLENGITEKLVSEKKPFYIRREQTKMEAGFHDNIQYIYDVYIPILSSSGEVVAIMAFSRFSSPFTQKETAEYGLLAKQIAISLEKIELYEQTESSRRLNQDIINTIHEGIQLIDNQGSIVQINKQLIEMFDELKIIENPDSLTWQEWTTLMAREIEDESFLALLTRAANCSGTSTKEEQSFIYKNKSRNRVFNIYCENLFKGEKKLGTILVHRDITKEYEVDQMKSEFVSTVSHELRTPLASVLGFTELMLNKELKPERQKKYLQTIYHEGKRLTSLINDFLDVQRMEAGKQTYEKKDIDLVRILEKVIENQQINSSEHKITLVNSASHPFVLGDRMKLEQVFMNLINNSIKYSPDGGNIKVVIYDKDESILVDVRDEGLGIPQESIPKLFRKFYRVDNSDRRKIGGTGLGLAIVQEIVRGHGGEITVTSEFGKGSIFTVTFPKIEQLEPEIDEQDSSAQEGRESSYTVVVIEDDQSLAELINHELLDSGFQVSYFKRGTDALQAMKLNTPDAVVLDIMLEEDAVDGWAIMEMIKESQSLMNVPIFVSTALDEREKGFSLGAKDYLIKPYNPAKLSKVIMQTLISNGKKGQILIPQTDGKQDQL